MKTTFPVTQHTDATCTVCGTAKRPARAYLALLQSQSLPYICKQCRESAPPPPMSLGKLGVL